MTSLALIAVEAQNLPAEYRGMLERVQAAMPMITSGASNFHKSASQFKMGTLDITPLTPIRTMRQMLAELDHTKQALEEAATALRKNDLEIRRREHRLGDGQRHTGSGLPIDQFDKELMEIELQEYRWRAENITNGMKGAIRKFAYLTGQFVSMWTAHGGFTEEDFEKEEVAYHIATAMKQALIAARANGGRIDEGNHIYLFDLGINGAMAQAEITDYLNWEREQIKVGKMPTHAAALQFLDRCVEKFSSYPETFAKVRGFTLLDRTALNLGAKRGDAS